MADQHYNQYPQIQYWNEKPRPITATNNLTPFGFYDNDPLFRIDAPKVAIYAARQLGYPIVDIELQDLNFYAAFEDSINEYSNQVNQYNIKDNMLSLQGAEMDDFTNLSQKEITPSLGHVVSISETYGTEAGTGGNTNYYSASIAVQPGNQVYDLERMIFSGSNGTLVSGSNIEIKKVYHDGPPAIVRYFDPYAGTALATNNMLSTFGWGNMSPGMNFMMMPLFGDVLRVQAIEMNDTIRKSAYSFDIQNNKLTIFPIPDYNFNLWFEFIIIAERNNPLKSGPNHDGTGVMADFTNIPYKEIQYGKLNQPSRQWIRKYTAALAKEILGAVRSKYKSIPIPNKEMQLDGDELKSQAKDEKEKLISDLREMLDTLTKKDQMERKALESEAMQKVLSQIPLKIYIG